MRYSARVVVATVACAVVVIVGFVAGTWTFTTTLDVRPSWLPFELAYVVAMLACGLLGWLLGYATGPVLDWARRRTEERR